MNCTEEGFLIDPSAWNPTVAAELAQQDDLALSEQHMEILYTVREFYFKFDHSPAMRPLVKFIANKLGKDKASSIYLLKLFPGSPAKFAAKYAGIPKPDKCL